MQTDDSKWKFKTVDSVLANLLMNSVITLLNGSYMRMQNRSIWLLLLRQWIYPNIYKDHRRPPPFSFLHISSWLYIELPHSQLVWMESMKTVVFTKNSRIFSYTHKNKFNPNKTFTFIGIVLQAKCTLALCVCVGCASVLCLFYPTRWLCVV